MYRPKYLKKNKKSGENLLEIYLKDMDSVPVVYLKGKRVFNKGLKKVEYNWRTKESVSSSNQLINITGYDLHEKNKYPILDTIKKESIGWNY